MDTSSIRAFASTARIRLLAGVNDRLKAMGFAEDGTLADGIRPVRADGGVNFRGKVIDDPLFYDKWTALEVAVATKGYKEVRDEVAYTWFNRFCAIRILAKRQLISPAIEYVGNKASRTPALVAALRAGDPLTFLSRQERTELERIRFDDAKTTEQFAILITAFCRATPAIAKCFNVKDADGSADYLSLLLPQDVLAPDGFVDKLNDPATISDADYREDELIGWLYQYYISERKQEVFNSFKDGKKAAAEDIPAATQIFTPNWIVKYMVQNSLGRLAIENGFGGDFTKDWRYLIREEDGKHPPCLKVDSPEELSFADVACGSGHILLEGFRHLLPIYAEAGYSKRQAVELIFRKNLVGVDLDIRARQLSQFALLLAAMTVDPSFSDAHVLPRVLDMEGTLGEGRYSRAEIATVLSLQDDALINELQEAFGLLTQAKNLGSIMKFKISETTREILAIKVTELEAQPDNLARKYLPSFRLILALTNHYAAIVTNPPYMGSSNMNDALADYVKANYTDGKADLFAVFIRLCLERCHAEGIVGMITMQSWMFLASFQKLRQWVLGEKTILTMAHLGVKAFDSVGGEVVSTTAFSLSNRHYADYKGAYLRLIDGQNEAGKESLFLAGLSRVK